MCRKLTSMSINRLLERYPYAADFFSSLGLQPVSKDQSVEEYLTSLDDELLQAIGMEKSGLADRFVIFMKNMRAIKADPGFKIESVTIVGGYDKSGDPENLTVSFKPGEIICIVGPTGSGKSRLLADIECMARKDTPTRRLVLINGQVPDMAKRFSSEHKLVAQLSQNMNFIMDLTVGEFVAMHAESRMMENVTETVRLIVESANELAGEKFSLETPATQLSGGQSRALMIADTAYLSSCPVILIDEIENAGVDRRKALDILINQNKIVLMATHDPILALMGHKRLVIKNGGINRIIDTSELERANLKILQKLDVEMVELRNTIRNGELIDNDLALRLKDVCNPQS